MTQIFHNYALNESETDAARFRANVRTRESVITPLNIIC